MGERLRLANWRRFSLREILLAMAAIAALLALYRQSRPPQTTDFVRGFNAATTIREIGIKHELPLCLHGVSGGPIEDSEAYYEARYEIREFEPIEMHTKLMPALRSEIARRLSESDCTTDDWSVWGGQSAGEVTAFIYRYRKGMIRGVIRAQTGYTEQGDPQLWITIDEW